MFPRKPTQKQVVGRIGEDCTCEYLKRNGYTIIDRNYLRKWGEIDIVAKKSGRIHFVEVKTVSREMSEGTGNSTVTHGTGDQKGEYRPEDNMHPWKLQRLGRVIQSYLLDKDVSDETEWQCDVATVYVDIGKRLSRVHILDDIVL